MTPAQSFLGFEQSTQDAELAAANARLQAKLAAQAQRAIRKRQEEMDKNTRRWKREEKARAKNDTLTAQCGINWYNRRRDAGIFWTHCKHLRPGTDLHRRPERQTAGVRRAQIVTPRTKAKFA